jgi:hypothetical protein
MISVGLSMVSTFSSPVFNKSPTEFAAKTKNIVMNYTNYETAIVGRHQIKLVGWTFNKLVSPSEIGTMDDI